jgi:hypothetical protein
MIASKSNKAGRGHSRRPDAQRVIHAISSLADFEKPFIAEPVQNRAAWSEIKTLINDTKEA